MICNFFFWGIFASSKSLQTPAASCMMVLGVILSSSLSWLWAVTHTVEFSAVQPIQRWALMPLYTILTPLSKTRLKLRVIIAVESMIITLSELSAEYLWNPAFSDKPSKKDTQGKTLLGNKFSSLFQLFGKDSIFSSIRKYFWGFNRASLTSFYSLFS